MLLFFHLSRQCKYTFVRLFVRFWFGLLRKVFQLYVLVILVFLTMFCVYFIYGVLIWIDFCSSVFFGLVGCLVIYLSLRLFLIATFKFVYFSVVSLWFSVVTAPIVRCWRSDCFPNNFYILFTYLSKFLFLDKCKYFSNMEEI